MYRITDIPTEEIELQAIRASGPGGQHVNKVSTGIHLRFDIGASSLPPAVRQRLRSIADRRVTPDGVVVIKATQFRSQEKNRQDALARLDELLMQAQRKRKHRIKTKPTKASVQRRLTTKNRRGDRKRLRTRPRGEE
ncbi:MAG: alternative ribosome rescue aminoacyl-tRNA hydrolase ArfB [Pseudomonadota bacterium]